MRNKETDLLITDGDTEQHKKHMIRSIAIRIYSEAIAHNPKDPSYRAVMAVDSAKILVDKLEEEGLL